MLEKRASPGEGVSPSAKAFLTRTVYSVSSKGEIPPLKL
jgi:hypothetical protein